MHQKCTYGSVGASGGQLPEATWPRDYSFHHRTFSGHPFGADEFLGLFRLALRGIAKEDPNAALGVLSKLDASKHEAFLHLHLEMVSTNGAGLYRHFLIFPMLNDVWSKK